MTHTNHFMLEHHNSSSSESRRKEDRGNSLVSDMVGFAQSEVYTHIGCSVALKGAAIDVECPLVPDGPSLVAVEFSTRCCRSVCSSVAQEVEGRGCCRKGGVAEVLQMANHYSKV